MITIEGKQVLTTLEELVDPAYTALLLIDIQNDTCSPAGHHGKVGINISTLQQVPSRVKPVLEAARQCGVMVVHILNTYYPGRREASGAWLRMSYKKRGAEVKLEGEGGDAVATMMAGNIEGTWGWQESSELTPLPGEMVVKKNRSSAFVGTNLDLLLRNNGIRSVVSVGVVTEGCVESTARHAQFLDYYSVLLRDCVATARQDIHEAALKVMSDRLDVVDSSQVLEIWRLAEKKA